MNPASSHGRIQTDSFRIDAPVVEQGTNNEDASMKLKKPLFALAFAALFCSSIAFAETISVADVHAKRTELKGEQVTVVGKVVKVNNSIMNRNFIHIGDESSDDAEPLTFTSQQTANVGDRVRATGTVKLDVDFGMGYFYPILIEESTIEPTE